MGQVIVLLKRMLIVCMAFCSAVPLRALAYSARSSVVMERSTATVLYEENAKEKLGMASTTKIMTAIVALEQLSPDETVTVSETAAGTEGSSMYLQAGETVRTEELLYGMMLQSGNDAAVALAEHVGGTVEAFCAMMNRKAAEIGANDTHFSNPSGLAEEMHYTTAYDLGLIACYALQNEQFRTIVGTRQETTKGENGSRSMVNHNKMLWRYEGCTGVKTGFTKRTGRTLVSSAVRDGMELVVVTLDDPDDWNDHCTLLDRAFEQFRKTTVLQAGERVATVTVRGGRSDSVGVICGGELAAVHLKEDGTDYETETKLPDVLEAPVRRGACVGKVRLIKQGRTVGYQMLYAEQAVREDRKKQLFLRLNELLQCWIAG